MTAAPPRRNPGFSQRRDRLWVSAVRPVFLLLGLTGIVLAAPAGPGGSAIDFLEKVRSGTINLEPGSDTAMAAQTNTRKRQEIARRLERLARDLGNDPLEIGQVRQDDDLAAVLVRKSGSFDPARLQVFPVALIRRGGVWLAAPLPASFENSGVGYSAEIRRRLDALQAWMLREQVVLREQLGNQAAVELRQRISASVSANELRSLTAAQAGDRFLKACQEGNLPEILALTGGLSQEPPENWPARLQAAETAVREPAVASRLWRLLAAREVVRVPLFQEDTEDLNASTLSIACLDPTGKKPVTNKPVIEIVELKLQRDRDGLWLVSPEENDTGETGPDAGLLDMFPSKLSLRYPAMAAESAVALRDTLMAAFENDSASRWISQIGLHGDPADQREACLRAAAIWWDARNPANSARPLPIDFLESENLAAVACQFFSARQPDRTDLRLLVLEKTRMGWLWNPIPGDETMARVKEWSESRRDAWMNGWRDKLLADCPEVESFAEGSAPTEKAAAGLISDWLAALAKGDIAAAIRLTARLKQPDSRSQLLRNLGYELAGVRRSKQPPELISIIPGKRLSAATTRTISDNQPVFPLYTIISTPSGPRILLEVDLIHTSNRRRDFLNRSALERLRKQDANAADELGSHFDNHFKRSRPDSDR